MGYNPTGPRYLSVHGHEWKGEPRNDAHGKEWEEEGRRGGESSIAETMAIFLDELVSGGGWRERHCGLVWVGGGVGERERRGKALSTLSGDNLRGRVGE